MNSLHKTCLFDDMKCKAFFMCSQRCMHLGKSLNKILAIKQKLDPACYFVLSKLFLHWIKTFFMFFFYWANYWFFNFYRVTIGVLTYASGQTWTVSDMDFPLWNLEYQEPPDQYSFSFIAGISVFNVHHYFPKYFWIDAD